MKQLLPVVFLICLTGLIFQGCKKDDNTPEKSFRLKAWSKPSTNDRVDILYDGDRIKEMKLTRNGVNDVKLCWEYVGDSIKIKQWQLYQSEWIRSVGYDHCLIVDKQGRLLEHLFHIDNYYYQINYAFEWEGDKLKRQSGYFLSRGVAGGAMDFTYSGDKITRMDYDQNFGYEELIYDGDNPVEMKYFLHDNFTDDVKFNYTDNKITFISSKRPGSTIGIYEGYTYDDNNNVRTRTTSLDSTLVYGNKIEFEYESGKGNLDLYWLARYGRLATYFRPNMIPSEIAVGTWSLCGEREWMQL